MWIAKKPIKKRQLDKILSKQKVVYYVDKNGGVSKGTIHRYEVYSVKEKYPSVFVCILDYMAEDIVQIVPYIWIACISLKNDFVNEEVKVCSKRGQ